MQPTNTRDAKTTPARERFPDLARRYHAHKPAAGRNDRREVLFRAARPHNAPKVIQGNQPSRSSNVSASQQTTESNSADRLVSQIQRVHQKMTLGNRAHAHADPTATCLEKIRRAIRKIGRHVNAEHRLLKVSRAIAAALE